MVPPNPAFKRYYGPTHKAFPALDPSKQAALAEDVLGLIGKHNRGGDAMVLPSEYLEAVITLR